MEYVNLGKTGLKVSRICLDVCRMEWLLQDHCVREVMHGR
jgi:aryl-alcohol dehydrogenase-like predicted oxidoreductase